MLLARRSSLRLPLAFLLLNLALHALNGLLPVDGLRIYGPRRLQLRALPLIGIHCLGCVLPLLDLVFLVGGQLLVPPASERGRHQSADSGVALRSLCLLPQLLCVRDRHG